ncbi:MAG: hypothetical protein PHF60_05245 [Candidatus ainarchaeum sp.]|nr:hypothetical protein [Candidatus ainarchaeum sp.]
MAFETAAASAPCCCISSFFLLMGLAMAGEGARQYFMVQKIRNTPTSKVRSAAAGLVELAGKAMPTAQGASPVTKTPAVYWKVLAQYYYQSRKHSGWRTFYSKSSKSRFYLEDDTGKVLIEPVDAEISVKPDFYFNGHLSDKTFFGLIPQKQLDAQVLRYLKENPDAEQAFKGQGGKLIRMYEYFVGPKDDIYVLGSAQPLEGAKSEVAHENLIIRKDKADKIMYISDSSEKAIVGGMSVMSWVYLILGGFMTAGAFLAVLFAVSTMFMG